MTKKSPKRIFAELEGPCERTRPAFRIRSPLASEIKSENRPFAVSFSLTRQKVEMGQMEFAATLGISQGALSKIEDGSMTPSVHLWLHFCEVYSVDPYLALAGKGTRKKAG